MKSFFTALLLLIFLIASTTASLYLCDSQLGENVSYINTVYDIAIENPHTAFQVIVDLEPNFMANFNTCSFFLRRDDRDKILNTFWSMKENFKNSQTQQALADAYVLQQLIENLKDKDVPNLKNIL